VKRYRFPLHTVLRVRQSQEDIAGATLLEANRQVSASTEVLDATVVRHEQRPPIAGPMDSATFAARQARGAWSAAAVRHAENVRADAEQQANQARGLWQEAARRVKALERLDDRRRAEHHLLAERAGDRETDDIVVGRHGRER
jgi:flagellar export protein FliJ